VESPDATIMARDQPRCEGGVPGYRRGRYGSVALRDGFASNWNE